MKNDWTIFLRSSGEGTSLSFKDKLQQGSMCVLNQKCVTHNSFTER